jgi:uncharacterized protein HemY
VGARLAPGSEPPPRSQETHRPRVQKSAEENLGEAHYQRALDHLSSSDYHEAVVCLKEAIRYDPNKAEYHRVLGQTMLKNPLWTRQAQEHFHIAFEKNSLDTESCLELAKIYDDNGLKTRAGTYYRKVLEIDTENAEAKQRLSQIESANTSKVKGLARSLLSRLKAERT